MFDRFGEFDSVEELNAKAAELFEANDEDGILKLAEENGLDKEDAEDYMDGCTTELATLLTAAVGKLNLEAKELKAEGVVADWKDFIIQSCAESFDLCKAVRKKGKSMDKCLGEILKHAFNSKKKLDDRIVKAAGLKPPLYMGFPSKVEVKDIIMKYYMG